MMANIINFILNNLSDYIGYFMLGLKSIYQTLIPSLNDFLKNDSIYFIFLWYKYFLN